jgi:hypothetical protein
MSHWRDVIGDRLAGVRDERDDGHETLLIGVAISALSINSI